MYIYSKKYFFALSYPSSMMAFIHFIDSQIFPFELGEKVETMTSQALVEIYDTSPYKIYHCCVCGCEARTHTNHQPSCDGETGFDYGILCRCSVQW